MAERRSGRAGGPVLRAVKDGESAKKAPAKRAPRKVTPVSVAAAARSGDHRQLLVALGNRIAKSLDDPGTTGPAFAALVKQAREIAADIQAIDAAAAAKKLPPPPSVLANTPDEAWDESMI